MTKKKKKKCNNGHRSTVVYPKVRYYLKVKYSKEKKGTCEIFNTKL